MPVRLRSADLDIDLSSLDSDQLSGLRCCKCGKAGLLYRLFVGDLVLFACYLRCEPTHES